MRWDLRKVLQYKYSYILRDAKDFRHNANRYKAVHVCLEIVNNQSRTRDSDSHFLGNQQL